MTGPPDHLTGNVDTCNGPRSLSAAGQYRPASQQGPPRRPHQNGSHSDRCGRAAYIPLSLLGTTVVCTLYARILLAWSERSLYVIVTTMARNHYGKNSENRTNEIKMKTLNHCGTRLNRSEKAEKHWSDGLGTVWARFTINHAEPV